MLRIVVTLALVGFLPEVAFGRQVVAKLRSAGACAAQLVATAEGQPAVNAALQAGVSEYTLDLDPTRVWQLEYRGEDCWAEPVVWSGEASAVEVTLYPSAVVAGRFLASATRTVAAVRARLFQHDSPSSGVSVLGTAGIELRCVSDLPNWSCSVPAGPKFDVRLEPSGFAPLYYWDLTLATKEVRKLAPQPLIYGASIAGWVQTPVGDPLSGARVAVYPLEATRSESTERLSRNRALVTDRRGFFSVGGLAPGSYRVVSRAAALSPAVVSIVTVEAGESVVWPRAIRHESLAELELSLDPPLDPEGREWVVELTEQSPLEPSAKVMSDQGPANPSGVWRRAGLRAAMYSLSITNKSGSRFEEREVDLAGGGRLVLPISIQRILVRGTLLLGDEPLQARIRFANTNGLAISTSTNDSGSFEAPFPEPGSWRPEVFYPDAKNAARLHARPIEVTTDLKPVEIRLPGGRLRGVTVDELGSAVMAAVHVSRNGQLVTQQMTNETGEFDLVGLSEGSYTIEAEGREGTSGPITAEVEKSETSDLTVVLARYRVITGSIMTPDGLPASGAVVRISTNGGHRWSRVITNVRGDFRYNSRDPNGHLLLVPLTYSYPTVLVNIGAIPKDHLTITLPRHGGILHVRTTEPTYVWHRGVAVPFSLFWFPEPFGLHDGGIHLAPGEYAVCRGPVRDDACRAVALNAGSNIVIDMSKDERGNDAPVRSDAALH